MTRKRHNEKVDNGVLPSINVGGLEDSMEFGRNGTANIRGQGELSVNFPEVFEKNEALVARVNFKVKKFCVHSDDFSDLLSYLNMLPNDSEKAKKYLWKFSRQVI